MDALHKLEKKLDDPLTKNAPFQLPENVKEALVKYLPWVNLAAGILMLWAAWGLWEWARVANAFNDLARLYGVEGTSRLTFVIWLALGTLVLEAVLYLLAFPLTRDRKKSGWDLMFLALLVNIVYGVVIIFGDYGSFGNLIGTAISSVVGLYLLFQIKSKYLAGK